MNWKKVWMNKWEAQPVLMLITVVIWSIFIGLCVHAGSLLFTFAYSLFKPPIAQDLYQGLNLYGLLDRHVGFYVAAISLLVIIVGSKAYIFYLMIRIFLKINLMHPFSTEIAKLISKIGEVTIQVGITIILASAYFSWLSAHGFDPEGHTGFLGGSGEFLMMGAIIYAIAQIFKRGVEIQSENELTV